MKRLIAVLDRHFGIITIFPAALCIVVIFGYPMGMNIWLSFTNKSMISKNVSFVGLANYARVLGDPVTWNALKNGVAFSLFAVGSQTIIGFAAALMIFSIKTRRVQTTVRNLLLIPWATPFISSVFIWRWIYNDLLGLLNRLLMAAGIILSPVPWLGTPGLAMFSVVARTAWFGTPLMMVSILAGMQSIPSSQLDYARLEGATTFQLVRHVIFPNVRGIVGILAILRTIWTFNNFGNIYSLTGGGPQHATETLPLLAYQTAWGQFLLGKSGALCVVITFFLAILLFVYFKLLRIKENVSL
ncbi:sugar ABC transporter permease [candidate division KSB3 bacterium]|uniref:Sugar ABC transporter permease n=1 Tax=candidate division KSB3 bacterium TaxID=2044937 RepID=A0A2G6K6U5_9BACT|nr:MAG: sugar ABC transporter permease [candidate division KSB3 bacterium]